MHLFCFLFCFLLCEICKTLDIFFLLTFRLNVTTTLYFHRQLFLFASAVIYEYTSVYDLREQKQTQFALYKRPVFCFWCHTSLKPNDSTNHHTQYTHKHAKYTCYTLHTTHTLQHNIQCKEKKKKKGEKKNKKNIKFNINLSIAISVNFSD